VHHAVGEGWQGYAARLRLGHLDQRDVLMSASALFAAGDLAGCLAQLQSDVRRQPADGKLRVFLAQLLMVSGDWDRAVTQLSVAAELDAGALPMLHAYSAAIQCERLRADVF